MFPGACLTCHLCALVQVESDDEEGVELDGDNDDDYYDDDDMF